VVLVAEPHQNIHELCKHCKEDILRHDIQRRPTLEAPQDPARSYESSFQDPFDQQLVTQSSTSMYPHLTCYSGSSHVEYLSRLPNLTGDVLASFLCAHTSPSLLSPFPHFVAISTQAEPPILGVWRLLCDQVDVIESVNEFSSFLLVDAVIHSPEPGVHNAWEGPFEEIQIEL
jgi:hypothetical protein